LRTFCHGGRCFARIAGEPKEQVFQETEVVYVGSHEAQSEFEALKSGGACSILAFA
jgi:hypothetical protein